MIFQPKTLKLLMVLDLTDVFQYINAIHPKHQTKNSTHKLSFKVHM